MLKKLLLAEARLEEAYEAFYELQYETPWATDYQRHQVDAEISYCESVYNEALDAFQAVYF